MSISKESIERWKKGGEFSPEDMEMFAAQVGGDTAGMEYWNDEAVNKYLEHLSNTMNEASKSDVQLLAERVGQLEKKLGYVTTLLLHLMEGARNG